MGELYGWVATYMLNDAIFRVSFSQWAIKMRVSHTPLKIRHVESVSPNSHPNDSRTYVLNTPIFRVNFNRWAIGVRYDLPPTYDPKSQLRPVSQIVEESRTDWTTRNPYLAAAYYPYICAITYNLNTTSHRKVNYRQWLVGMGVSLTS